ncbi:hypothetical protein VCHA36P164_280028 [Vibrio chagasii]|nr:hypothetical protein VCHA36P164_280028 [Vibrio chagasii]
MSSPLEVGLDLVGKIHAPNFVGHLVKVIFGAKRVSDDWLKGSCWLLYACM